MFQRTGNNKYLPIKNTTLFWEILLLNLHFPQQILQFNPVLFICKIVCKTASNHRANTINRSQFFRWCCQHCLEIIPVMLTKQSSIWKTDIQDSKTVDQLRQRYLSCLLDRYHQALIRLLPKTVHLYNRIMITIQMEHIRRLTQKTALYELLQRCLRHSLYVESITADK